MLKAVYNSFSLAAYLTGYPAAVSSIRPDTGYQKGCIPTRRQSFAFSPPEGAAAVAGPHAAQLLVLLQQLPVATAALGPETLSDGRTSVPVCLAPPALLRHSSQLLPLSDRTPAHSCSAAVAPAAVVAAEEREHTFVLIHTGALLLLL